MARTMPKKKSPNELRIRNSTAEFLTFAYQAGGDGVAVRVTNHRVSSRCAWPAGPASGDQSLRRHERRKPCPATLGGTGFCVNPFGV